jgi:hypothetical protein
MLTELEGVELAARFARDRFLYGLEQTPDDRLEWAPSEGAPTPLALAGKVPAYLGFITYNLIHGEFPERPAAPPPPPAGRREAVAAIEAAFAGFFATLAAVTPEQLDRQLPAPWGGTQSGRAWLALSCQVFGYLQGQFNYVQVCYGDTNPNMPPSWAPAG